MCFCLCKRDFKLIHFGNKVLCIQMTNLDDKIFYHVDTEQLDFSEALWCLDISDEHENKKNKSFYGFSWGFISGPFFVCFSFNQLPSGER